MCVHTTWGACEQCKQLGLTPGFLSAPLGSVLPPPSFLPIFLSALKHFLVIHGSYLTADHDPPKPHPLDFSFLLWPLFEGCSGLLFITVSSSSFPWIPTPGPPRLPHPSFPSLPSTTPNKSHLILNLLCIAYPAHTYTNIDIAVLWTPVYTYTSPHSILNSIYLRVESWDEGNLGQSISPFSCLLCI